MHFDWRERNPSRYFCNEDIAKGALVSGTHVEPKSVYALNETTFLVTYSSEILAEEIGSAIENIDEWLGNFQGEEEQFCLYKWVPSCHLEFLGRKGSFVYMNKFPAAILNF